MARSYRTKCKHGHEYAQVGFTWQWGGGKAQDGAKRNLYRACNACAKLRAQAYRARAKRNKAAQALSAQY